MRPLATRTLLCVLLLLVGGCVGTDTAGPDGEGTATPSESGCVWPTGDPAIPECPLATHPADLEYANYDDEVHDVSMRVEYENGTTVFERTVTMEPETVANETDVFERPGTYTVTATLDGETTQTENWTLGERYRGEGGVEWRIAVRSGRLYNGRIAHQ